VIEDYQDAAFRQLLKESPTVKGALTGIKTAKRLSLLPASRNALTERPL